MKIRMLVCFRFIMVIVALIFFFDFIYVYEPEEWQMAETAVRNMVNTRFQDKGKALFVVEHEIQRIDFDGKREEKYIASCTYRISYGEQDEAFLDLRMKETVWLVRSEASYEIVDTQVEILDSSINGNGDIVTSIAEREKNPFISTAEAEGMFEREIAQCLLGKLLIDLGMTNGEKRSFVVAGSTFVTRVEPIEMAADENIIHCWKVDGGIEGIYIGYMDEFGYSLPLFQDELDYGTREVRLEPFYLLEKAEGYYLVATLW